MQSATLKRHHPMMLTMLVSAGILLTALAAHSQTVTGNTSGPNASNTTSNAQSGQPSAAGKTTPMGSGADASGNAGASKAGAKAAGADGKLSKADSNFMRDITYSNISEIATAKLAQSKSQNDQVKTFAQRMIDDHTKAQQELEQLAQSKGVTLPTEPDTKHKAASKAMEKLSADKFDAMYMKQAGENDHQNTQKLLQKVKKNAKDADLKAYADKTLGPVDEHLKMAEQMRAADKSSKGADKGADKTAEKNK
jgi:putative membrane protein